MAYIYRKIINGNPYYYLRISKRVKGKIIVKDVAYLGNNISKIDKSKYKNEIRNSYRNIKKYIQEEHYIKKIRSKKIKISDYFNLRDLEEIEAIKLHYNNKFLKFDEKTKNEVYKHFLIDFAFNTTSIEGNTISLNETNKLLKENITPKDKTLREIHDIKNTEKVFFNLINSKKKINHNLIIDIHDNLLENIDDRKGYRIHDIRVFKTSFKPTPFPYIKSDIEILLKNFKLKKNINLFALCSIFHHKFEKIHPFSDGNGRTGRMLFCFMLMKFGYPPIIIRKKTRNKYIENLNFCNKADLNDFSEKHYKKLIRYFKEEYVKSYWENFNV